MRERTIAIHAGYIRDSQKTMTPPIYQSTAYAFDDTNEAAALFNLEKFGNIYTRLTNPTVKLFEDKFCALEGGVGAVATASGTAAIFYTIANVASKGDNILVAKQVYGGTSTMVNHTIKPFGIEARNFDVTSLDELENLIDEKTKLILFEVLPNPALVVPDIEKIVEIGKKFNILVAADNTVATPILIKPIDWGVDITLHSATKYAGGQGTSLGGIIIEGRSAKEKIVDNVRYKRFNEADESYHGLVYTKVDHPPFTLRARLALLRDFGAAMSPFNAWLLSLGLETLPLRMRQHSSSAKKIAQFLLSHPKVERVNYPALKESIYYPLVEKYFKEAMGSGLISFVLKDPKDAYRVANSTKIFKIAANIADSRSIITHPASTTHQQLSKEELKAAGVEEGLIRLSIGLEDEEDLIEDLAQALN
ncbi:MAG: O-acetylhomoserine aminocarboxypropyltransferase/cysteine synthase [Epsilonproteobacteria bacterium]|nr:O-acetylhomoserine aminocarboxypropyltransferase/cysteine synthase [Campylobacterota bacterium]